jgi:hypothetical protein
MGVIYQTFDNQIGTQVELIYLPVKEFIKRIEIPREMDSLLISQKFLRELKKGIYLPPITAVEFNGKYYIVDGLKRTQAIILNAENIPDREIIVELWKDINFEKLFKLLVRLGNEKLKQHLPLLAKVLNDELDIGEVLSILEKVIKEKLIRDCGIGNENFDISLLELMGKNIEDYIKELKEEIKNFYFFL